MGVRGDGAERGTGGCIERHHGDEGGVVFCFFEGMEEKGDQCLFCDWLNLPEDGWDYLGVVVVVCSSSK